MEEWPKEGAMTKGDEVVDGRWKEGKGKKESRTLLAQNHINRPFTSFSSLVSLSNGFLRSFHSILQGQAHHWHVVRTLNSFGTAALRAFLLSERPRLTLTLFLTLACQPTNGHLRHHHGVSMNAVCREARRSLQDETDAGPFLLRFSFSLGLGTLGAWAFW